MRFAGKSAIVTGGAEGIGLAVAIALATEGANITVADIDQSKGEIAAATLRTIGTADAKAMGCDVSDEDSVQACCEGVMSHFGRIDLIVNNAGLMTFDPIEKFNGKDWQKILGVDLMGAVYFTKQAFLRMNSGGAIVNISSIHAVETEPDVAPYAAAKTALLSLTRSTSIEGRSRGIRANAVLPGAIDTPMLWSNPNIKSGTEKLQPGDVGTPAHVAAAVAFLLSDAAAFISGAMLRVDGGRLAML